MQEHEWTIKEGVNARKKEAHWEMAKEQAQIYAQRKRCKSNSYKSGCRMRLKRKKQPNVRCMIRLPRLIDLKLRCTR